MKNPERRTRFPWKVFFWMPAIIVTVLVVRSTRLTEIGALMAKVDPGLLFLLVCLNIAILLSFSGRWKLILNSLGESSSLFRLVFYRLAGFSVSYFTPGTQFGGEPLQVLLLQRNHAIARNNAISSVYLDKLIELTVNFSLLLAGVTVSLGNGWIRNELRSPLVPAFAVVGLAPLLYLFLLLRRLHPASGLACMLAGVFPRSAFTGSAARVVVDAEERISTAINRDPPLLIGSLGISLAAWTLMIFEFQFMWTVIGQPLSLPDTIFAMTLARLAFLLPLPGGLGALEASQMLAMQVLGRDPAFGLAACLLIRARDISLGVIGFVAAGWFMQTQKVKAQ